MSERLDVLNQNEVYQDVRGVEMANFGMLDHLAREANSGKDISKIGDGGDSFNFLTEMVGTKKAVVSGAMQVYGEVAGSTPMSGMDALMGGGGPRDKRSRAQEALFSMNNSMGIPKTYAEKKQDAITIRMIQSGRFKKSKNPMMQGGTGLDFTGNKIERKKPTVLSAQMIMNNPHQHGYMAQKCVTNIGAARQVRENPSTSRTLMGLERGYDDAVQDAKRIDAGELFEKTQNKDPTMQEKMLESVLSKEGVERMMLTKADLMPTAREPEPAPAPAPKGQGVFLTKSDIVPPKRRREGVSLTKKPLPQNAYGAN